MNALENATIAKSVADFKIDHLLVDEPISATELRSVARDIAEDKVSNSVDIDNIVPLAMNYVAEDPRVNVTPIGAVDKREIVVHA